MATGIFQSRKQCEVACRCVDDTLVLPGFSGTVHVYAHYDFKHLKMVALFFSEVSLFGG